MLRFLSLIAATGLLVLPGIAAAGGEEYKPRADKEVLHTQKSLASGSHLEANAFRFTLPAGYTGGRHYHTGDVFVYIQSGELTVETGDGTRTYEAGELYYETPNEPMLVGNVSSSEKTVIVVLQVGKQGEPVMIKSEK